jgi:serine protease Do
MLTNKYDNEHIEQYLEGKLQGEALTNFVQEMQQNPALAQQVAELGQLLAELRHYGQHKQHKAMLDGFHAEIGQGDIEVGLTRYRTQFRVWRRRYFPTMAAAASVALLTVFGTLFTLDYVRSLEKTSQSNYRSLLRKIQQNQNKLNSLENSLDTAVRNSLATNRDQYLKGGGTGFAISADGYLLTSYHVVKKSDSIFIESTAQPDQRYKVDLIFGDEEADLALLKVNDKKFNGFGKIPYTFKSESADLGEEIFTLAYPREDAVYGEGAVSARSGYEGNREEYQVSIPVNPGNSGSPVFDAAGNVVGIIKGKQLESEGVAFALKSPAMINMISQLPPDTLKTPLYLPKTNRLAGQKRVAQVKRIEDFVFQVKVY